MVEVGLVGHGGDAADQPAHLDGVDVLAQGALGLEAVDDALGGRGQDLALGDDRGVGVAHRAGDLGRPALVQADQRDVRLEPAEQHVARRPSWASALSVASFTRSTQLCMIASSSARGWGSGGRGCPAPTPARLAISSRDASYPLLAEDLTRDLDDAVAVALARRRARHHPLLNGDSLRMVDPEPESFSD